MNKNYDRRVNRLTKEGEGTVNPYTIWPDSYYAKPLKQESRNTHNIKHFSMSESSWLRYEQI